VFGGSIGEEPQGEGGCSKRRGDGICLQKEKPSNTSLSKGGRDEKRRGGRKGDVEKRGAFELVIGKGPNAGESWTRGAPAQEKRKRRIVKETGGAKHDQLKRGGREGTRGREEGKLIQRRGAGGESRRWEGKGAVERGETINLWSRPPTNPKGRGAGGKNT